MEQTEDERLAYENECQRRAKFTEIQLEDLLNFLLDNLDLMSNTCPQIGTALACRTDAMWVKATDLVNKDAMETTKKSLQVRF